VHMKLVRRRGEHGTRPASHLVHLQTRSRTDRFRIRRQVGTARTPAGDSPWPTVVRPCGGSRLPGQRRAERSIVDCGMSAAWPRLARPLEGSPMGPRSPGRIEPGCAIWRRLVGPFRPLRRADRAKNWSGWRRSITNQVSGADRGCTVVAPKWWGNGVGTLWVLALQSTTCPVTTHCCNGAYGSWGTRIRTYSSRSFQAPTPKPLPAITSCPGSPWTRKPYGIVWRRYYTELCNMEALLRHRRPVRKLTKTMPIGPLAHVTAVLSPSALPGSPDAIPSLSKAPQTRERPAPRLRSTAGPERITERMVQLCGHFSTDVHLE
jgi:hypothetical protein